MLIGAHAIIYSANPDADRVFFRDVLRLPNIDVGGGWLIFGLPPAEVAVHPADKYNTHELYLMCDDVDAFIGEMKKHNISCGPVQDEGWGLLTEVTLPGGGKLGVYQPRHARPVTPAAKTAKKARKRVAKRRVKTGGRNTQSKARTR